VTLEEQIYTLKIYQHMYRCRHMWTYSLHWDRSYQK